MTQTYAALVRCYARPLFFSGAYLYFLGIALLRSSPYWPHGFDLPVWSGILFAVLPLLPGLVLRKPVWIIYGYLVALFTPYQVGIGFATVLVLLSLAVAFRHTLLRRIRQRPLRTNIFFWIGLYITLVATQWIMGFGSRHTFLSIAFSFYSILLTPLCLVLVSHASGMKGITANVFTLLFSLVCIQALVIVSYPLMIGHPEMLLAVVNGILKPAYTVLSVPTPYPWYNPDWNFGSLTIVNYAGIVMTMGTAYAVTALLRTGKLLYFAATLLVAFTMFLAENALAVGAAAGAFIAVLLSEALFRYMIPIRGRLLAVARVLAMIICLGGFLMVTYVGPGKFADSQKGIYYLESMRTAFAQPLRGMFGYGLGGYGSRGAYTQLLGDSALIKERAAESHRILTNLGHVPAGDFHRDFSKVFFTHSAWPGTTQGLIQSGLVAIIMENGIVGTTLLLILLLLCLHALPSRGNQEAGSHVSEPIIALFGISFLLCLSVFYNYNEIPTIVALLCLPAFLAMSRPSPIPAP